MEKFGREYILMKSDTNILNDVDNEDHDGEALTVHNFIRKVRAAISSAEVSFTDTFKQNCEEK